MQCIYILNEYIESEKILDYDNYYKMKDIKLILIT